MNRTFSVIRRRSHIVDLITPLVAGVQTYRLKWSANFDGTFTQFIDSTSVGFLDSNVNSAAVGTQPTAGRQVRIVFDPTTYSIPDGVSFWLQLFHVPFGGVEAAVSAAGLILADAAQHGTGSVIIQGNAPNVANSGLSLQLDFPRLMQDFRIHNQDTTNALFIATELGGAEAKMLPNAPPQFGLNSTQGSLWVRGGGGVVPFSIVCTAAVSR